jgi:uncharacterized protein
MNLPPWAAYGVSAAAICGHFALHLAAYNRINATGLHRRTIKGIVKVLLLTCVVLPLLAGFAHADQLAAAFRGELTGTDLKSLHGFWRAYGVVCLFALPLLGIPWLCWRPVLGLEAVDAPRDVEVHDVAAQVPEPLALTRKCRIAARIPGNQICELAVEHLELPVVNLPAALDGYRVAHLSDLHLTGHLSPALTAWAVSQANQWAPDLIALTGDIIDAVECIDWLGEALGHAVARDGCYFVLGNHDRRVPDPDLIRAAMTDLGWRDVGGQCVDVNWPRASQSHEVDRGVEESTAVQILGNERPWFGAPTLGFVQK